MLGLGKSFAAEVERTIYLIREFPDAGSPAGLTRRRVLVARFPYSVVYRRDPDSLSLSQLLINGVALATGGNGHSTLTARSTATRKSSGRRQRGS